MRAVYTVDNSADVSLVAATAKTTLAVIAPSTFGVDLLAFWLGFKGVNPSEASALWELCTLTGAANSTPSTGNTSESATILQEGGRSIAVGFIAFGGSTTEPTVLTPLKTGLLPPNGGYYEYEYPWGQSPDSPVSQGFALRVTATAAVSIRAGFRFGRS